MNYEKLKQLYFPHDFFADKDEKIEKMFFYYRKNIDKFQNDFIKSNFFLASFGLFWLVVQYLHYNSLSLDDLSMLADNFRVDEEFLRSVISDFGLFEIDKTGLIISKRVLKNLDGIFEKSNKNKSAAETRWLLSAFNKAYAEFFGEKPLLQPEEIETLKKYNTQIPDFREKLRDILYTLKELKFDTDINFKPCANWLLKDNHLARLVNGEFGKLKHKPTEKEIKEEQQKRADEERKKNEPSELQLQMETISGKAEALDFIEKRLAGKKLVFQRNKLIGIVQYRKLMEKFDITKQHKVTDKFCCFRVFMLIIK